MYALRKFYLAGMKIFYVSIKCGYIGIFTKESKKILEDVVCRKWLLVWVCDDIWKDLYSWMMQMISCNNHRVRRKENKCVEKKEEDLLWRWKVFRKAYNPVQKHNTPGWFRMVCADYYRVRTIDGLAAAKDSARVRSTRTVSTDSWVQNPLSFKGRRRMKVIISRNRKCVESLFKKWKERREAWKLF